MHLNQLITLLDSTALDSSLVLKSITIKGSASPEGSTPMNRQLSEKRAQSMKAYIVDHTTLNDFNIKVDSSDVDWEFLSEMIASTDLPWRDEAVKIIANTPIWVFKDKKIVDGRKKQLCMLQGGHAWEYMSKNFFPALRARFRIMCEWEISRPANNRGDECKTDECETIVNQPSTEERLADVGKDSVATSLVPDMRNTVSTDSLAFTAKSEKDRKFVMLLKTNMLYDVMAIPNIGIEIPITPKWSASANWMYAWWSNDTRHRFWRIYGGDVELRRWFSAPARHPFTAMRSPFRFVWTDADLRHRVGRTRLLGRPLELGCRAFLWIFAAPGETLQHRLHARCRIPGGRLHEIPSGRRLLLLGLYSSAKMVRSH